MKKQIKTKGCNFNKKITHIVEIKICQGRDLPGVVHIKWHFYVGKKMNLGIIRYIQYCLFASNVINFESLLLRLTSGQFLKLK